MTPTQPIPGAAPSTDWLSQFHPFTPHHLAIVALNAVFLALVITLALRCRDSTTERRIRLAWSLATLASAIGMTVAWMQPERYRPDTSWPLHLCDIAAWLTPYAMLSARRWPKTLLFFWGLGLSSQGFITPTVEEGMAHAVYWLFWIQHLGVVGGGLYLAVVNQYRPSLKDAGFAALVTIGLGLAMAALNLTFDTNYMYTGNMTPERPTLIDALGPWPTRLVWLALLVALACALTLGITKLVLAVSRRSATDHDEHE